jgi:capsular polysaccharide biosynthesis protein
MDLLISAASRLHSAGWTALARLLATFALALRPRHVATLTLSAQLATEAGDLGRSEMLCRRLLEHDPGHATALRVMGDINVRGPHPETALTYFAAYEKLVRGPDAVTRIFHQRHLDEDLARQLVLYYRRLENVLVDTAYWSIMTDGGIVYSPDTHGRNLANSPFVQHRAWDGGRAVIASFDAPKVRIERECIFVGGDDNYSHWVYRNLIKLASLDREGLTHTLPWLLNADLKPYQLEYLDMLGVPPEQRLLVERGQVVRCDKVLVPALLTNPATIGQGITWLRERLRAYLRPADEAEDRLYVSRADASRRHVVNEQALLRALEPYGFKLVQPGLMTALEQIRAFSGAELIIGPHGAGMTNIIFAPPHATFVELCSPNWSHMEDFRRTARAMGQPMTTFVSDRVDPAGSKDPQANYEVDVDAVVAHVERLCAAPRPVNRGQIPSGKNGADPTEVRRR